MRIGGSGPGACLPRHALNLELATGGLIELPVEELPLYRSWCLVQAKAKRLSPVARRIPCVHSQRTRTDQRAG